MQIIFTNPFLITRYYLTPHLTVNPINSPESPLQCIYDDILRPAVSMKRYKPPYYSITIASRCILLVMRGDGNLYYL